MTNELWDVWSSCHEEPDQQKRISSAKKSACTPTYIDMISQSGNFKGSSGNHTTSLEKCSCVDFLRRRKPCKHMYRLAMELDIFQESFDSDLSAVVDPVGKRESLEQTIKLVETLTENQQLLLLELLRGYTKKNPIICASKSDDLNVLIDSGILYRVYCPEVILPCYKKTELITIATSFELKPEKKLLKNQLITFIIENAQEQLKSFDFPIETLSVNRKIKFGKVHMYLHRKHETMSYYDVDMNCHTISLLETELPDDDVTALLRTNGYYLL